MLHGISGALEPMGYIAMVGETRDDSRKYQALLEKFASWPVAALISAASQKSDIGLLRRFQRAGLAVILAVRSLPSSGLATIAIDGQAGGSLVAEHLLALGHRRFAQLVGATDVEPFKDFSSGFLNTIGIRRDTEVVVNLPPAMHPTYEEGFRLMGLVLDRSEAEQPTAVFAHTDQMALGAIAALRQTGRHCPADVSVVGFNDSPMLALVEPPLTTVRWPAVELGRLAGEMAVRMVAQSTVKSAGESVPAELIVRGSTAPPPVRHPSRPRGRGR
jgi:LacI family transcriptional regulator